MKNRSEILVVIFIVLLVLVTRALFASKMLYFLDSVIYALALDKIDIANAIPPAPGYIGYIWLAKFFNWFLNNANRSFVLISIVFSCLSAVALYLAGKHLFSKKTGVIASLLFITSPAIWFVGGIALPHIVNIFSSVVFVLLCFKILSGEESLAAPLALFFGIMGSFRQDLILFLFPLWIFLCVFLAKKSGLKKIVQVNLIFLITALVWFIPSALNAGGIREYSLLCFNRLDAHFAYATYDNIVSSKMLARRYLKSIIRILFLGIVPLCYFIFRFFKKPLIIKNLRVQVFWVWFLPSFIYVNLVGGSHSYIFSHIGALFLISAEALRRISRKKISILAVSSILAVNIFMYFYDPDPKGLWKGVSWFRYSDIRKHDEMLGSKVAYIKNNFSPDDTAVFAGGLKQNYLFLAYYLPEFRVYQADSVYWDNLGKRMSLSQNKKIQVVSADPWYPIPRVIKNGVIFDEDLSGFLKMEGDYQKTDLQNGYFITSFPFKEKARLLIDRKRLEILIQTQ